MKYFCNPINVNYPCHIRKTPSGENARVLRSAADASMILYEGRYYVFATGISGVLVSDDLVSWERRPLPAEVPAHMTAPDARVLNGYVYLCASGRGPECDRFRTRDVLNGPYERIEGTFDYWDPNLFADEDGRVYFYWGSSNVTPIWGVELDPETMRPMGERTALMSSHPDEIGYERFGENNSRTPKTPEEGERLYAALLKERGQKEEEIPPYERATGKATLRDMPYIEGVWVDKFGGKYYLQYAAPGTEFNVYSDAVYVSDKPLGPYRLAENNPFSYKPGGYFPSAGHGSTMRDIHGNLWHMSTMRISVNDLFERRVGLWPAGVDADGELYCNQRYGDWPVSVSGAAEDPWRGPAWMLLSSGKTASASSFDPGHEPEKGIEENVQTWWRAAGASREEWLKVDLGAEFDVHAVQINFADDEIEIPLPDPRDAEKQRTQWKLEASTDGESWFTVCDKSDAETDLSHDLIVSEEGYRARYFRLSRIAVPFGKKPCVSGLRVFGFGDGEKPKAPEFEAVRAGDLDMDVTIRAQENTVGYNILFGASEDRLYHSWMVFEPGTLRVGALIKGRNYAVRVDAFNENGITEGTVRRGI